MYLLLSKPKTFILIFKFETFAASKSNMDLFFRNCEKKKTSTPHLCNET